MNKNKPILGRARLFIVAAFLLVMSNTTFAQLITNPGFETHTGCSTNITDATGWLSPTYNTPDYFHTCGYNYNFIAPHTGDGKVGGYLEWQGVDGKEYITTELTTPLVAGKTYIFSFYAAQRRSSPADLNTPVAERGFFGLCFSVGLPTLTDTTNGNYGSIKNDFAPNGRTYVPASHPFYSSQNQWFPVTLTYTATGGERYMTIGQFRPGVTAVPPNFGNYFFVDDVSGVEQPNALLTKSVSPSSITDGGTATYTFTVNNTTSGNVALSGINFTDTLPSSLRIASTPNVIVTGLTGGSTTATAGGTSVTASGYSIATNTTGTITVNVTNVSGQLNPTCTGNPPAFTNSASNISGLSSNLTNSVSPVCLTVTNACNAGTAQVPLNGNSMSN